MSINNSIFRIGSYLIAFLFLHGFILAQGNDCKKDSATDGITQRVAQADNETIIIRTESEFGYSPRMKRSVLPVKPIVPSRNVIEHSRMEKNRDENTVNDSIKSLLNHSQNKVSSGVQVNIGRNFEGNQMAPIFTPSDNTIAISNEGHILSIDNRSFAYFKENGDTVALFSLPFSTFYNDSTLNELPFDPRAIYDSYQNRFIAVVLYHSTFYSDARIFLSFSDPLVGDSITWNNYEIDCDSIFTNPEESYYWFDYPNISVTKTQLLLTTLVTRHDTMTSSNSRVGNVIMQIDKSQGYIAAAQLPRRVWKNVENTENNAKITIVPAMDAFQSNSYDTTCYLVSNYAGNSSKFFWFELNGDVYSPTAQLTVHANFPAFFYSVPSYASQLGGFGKDRISVLDCDIQYCLYQNKKLHFVFTRSDNGWAELVYANIEINSNLFSASTFSQANASLNCLRPSIASFGQDSTEENFMVAFLRTGPSIFPEVCVINFDSGWSAIPTLVKAGLGILDARADLVAPWDSLERWGDYTTIQRRYNDPFKRCWMVGAYPFGPNPNHWGAVNSVNAWIAEVGDSLPAIGFEEPNLSSQALVFPNPLSSGQELTIQMSKAGNYQIVIIDAVGLIKSECSFSGQEKKLVLEGFTSGMYFVTIIKNGQIHESQKITVLR